jgi:hypothetical protein
MTLLGEGAVCIWNDVTAEGRDEFYAWHETEHMPERVAIEGFLRGRRYIAAHAPTEWFTLYETLTTATLAGPAYLARLDHPTDWTRRTVRHFRNAARALTRVALRHGQGDGGHLLACGLAGGDGMQARLERLVGDRLLPRLRDDGGVCAAQLCLTDRAASTIETAEKRGREVGVPDAVLLIEASRPAVLIPWADELRTSLATLDGAAFSHEPGIYRLEIQFLPPG